MLWIRGGGFVAGAGPEPRYTNPALVSKNVVVVTINYRLAVFGFLASDDLMKGRSGACRQLRSDGHGGRDAMVNDFREAIGSS
jgi:carboxylesterase type B